MYPSDRPVGFKADFHAVERRKIGQQANITAVDWRSVEQVHCNEAVAHTGAKLRRRGKIFRHGIRRVDREDALLYVLFEYIISRLVIRRKDGVGKVYDAAVFHKGGVFRRIEAVGCVLVTAEMRVRSVEIRLVNPCHRLALALGDICRGVREKGGVEARNLAANVVKVRRRGGNLLYADALKPTFVACHNFAAAGNKIGKACLIIITQAYTVGQDNQSVVLNLRRRLDNIKIEVHQLQKFRRADVGVLAVTHEKGDVGVCPRVLGVGDDAVSVMEGVTDKAIGRLVKLPRRVQVVAHRDFRTDA